MVLIFCSILTIAAIGYTLFVRAEDIPPAPVENPELKHLETRRQVLYDNLKDLQFEYHQGKLSDGDYQSLKSGFLYDLAGVMDAIERQQPKTRAKSAPKTEAPAAQSKKPKAERAAHTCPSCGAANQPANRFCGHCGKPLA